MDIKSKLTLIGLNKYETNIYVSLIMYPEITASEISKYSGVPQNRVYDIIEQLINKKLVYLIPENPKRFKPESPKFLRELIKNKLNDLNDLDKEIERLEEDYKITNKNKVMVSRTAKNFDKIFDSISKAKEFNYLIQPKLSLLPKHLKSTKELSEAGVKLLSLTDIKLRDSDNLKKWKKYQNNFKFIETNDVVMNITEKGFLISLIPPENESLIIYIENENLSKIMKNMYEAYYNNLNK